MPTTGAYDATKFVIGPCKLYLGAPLPAGNASLSTVLTGTPPAPASGLLVGYTSSGVEYHSSIETEDYFVDEVASPIFTNVTAENASMTGTLVQLADIEVLKAMLPRYKFVTPDAFTYGGNPPPSAAQTPSVLAVGHDRANPAKTVAAMLYLAENIAEFVMAITRQNPSETDFEFKGYAIGTRPAGDQVSQIYFAQT